MTLFLPVFVLWVLLAFEFLISIVMFRLWRQINQSHNLMHQKTSKYQDEVDNLTTQLQRQSVEFTKTSLTELDEQLVARIDRIMDKFESQLPNQVERLFETQANQVAKFTQEELGRHTVKIALKIEETLEQHLRNLHQELDNVITGAEDQMRDVVARHQANVAAQTTQLVTEVARQTLGQLGREVDPHQLVLQQLEQLENPQPSVPQQPTKPVAKAAPTKTAPPKPASRSNLLELLKKANAKP